MAADFSRRSFLGALLAAPVVAALPLPAEPVVAALPSRTVLSSSRLRAGDVFTIAGVHSLSGGLAQFRVVTK